MAFYGSKGTLYADRYSYEVYPERGSDAPRKTVQAYDATEKHAANFADAIRGKVKQAATAEMGHQATVIASLGNVAFRSGHKIYWDAENETCKDDPEANRFLGRKARAPWDMLSCDRCVTG